MYKKIFQYEIMKDSEQWNLIHWFYYSKLIETNSLQVILQENSNFCFTIQFEWRDFNSKP